MRLNKYVAHCGICSRRKAAEMVKAGLISVNGAIEKNPAILVKPTDKVSYQGKLIQPQLEAVYLLMNKPKNVVTTMSDEKGRKTVWDMVKEKVKVRIFPIGRLDRNTTGLIILTNDGDLTQKLSHPKYNIKKIYEVQIDAELTTANLELIRKGFDLEDGHIKVDKISILNEEKTKIGIEIHSGRNRIIRRIFEHFEYNVLKLDRVYYAGLTKKDLPRGWSRDLTEQEIRMLKHFT